VKRFNAILRFKPEYDRSHNDRRATRHVYSTSSSKLAAAETACIRSTSRHSAVLNVLVTSPTPPKVNRRFRSAV